MKALKNMKKTFRSFLVFAMAFLVATSTLATAFATYQTLKPVEGPQKVNVDHIWVDSGNKDNTRPDKVETDVTATDNKSEEDDKSVGFVKDENKDDLENDEYEVPKKDTITDDGSTAGKEAGANAAEKDIKDLEASDIKDNLKPTNPGKDDGFKEGFEEGYKDAVNEANKDKGENDQIKVEWPDAEPGEGEEAKPGEGEETKPGEGEETKPGEGEETKPGEGEETQPPKASQDPLQELDQDVAGAIQDILKRPEDGGVVIPTPGTDEDKDAVKDNVDKITGELLDKPATDTDPAVKDQGNVWHESEDYVAQVEDKTGVTYEVELTEDTKTALKESGYDSVQLKITYEALYELVNSDDVALTDKNGNTVDQVLVKRTFVSYDGKNFETVPGAMKSTDGGKTWTTFDPDEYMTDEIDEGNDGVKEVLNREAYDPEKDYIHETTYTFMHVLKYEAPEKPTDPKDPPKNPPKDPPEEELPEEEVPKVDIEEPEEEIPDPDVPLADVPETGDNSGVWPMLAMLAVTGLLGVALLERKKAENS